MPGTSRGGPIAGGIEESMEKCHEANQPTTIGEQSIPRPSRQYRPNEDPSLYLYGNAPRSTLEPYVSSIADWNNPNITQQRFQYGSPEIPTGHNAGPYYWSNLGPYVMTDTQLSRVKHAAQAVTTPYQGYGVPDLSNNASNLRSKNMGNRTRGGSAARTTYASRLGNGAYDDHDPSKTLNNPENLRNKNLKNKDEEGIIPSATETAGRNFSPSTQQIIYQIASRTTSITVPEQGVLGETQHNPIEHSPDDGTIRHSQGKGEVKWENGTMVWRELKFDGTEEPWQPAVYHYQIREELIVAAKAQGTYDFPRDEGLAENDVTCFLFAQKTWNVADRAHRPDILFQWKKAGHRNPTYVAPDWYHDGRIVLDADNRPVRKFRNIPDTCSSMLEGGIMEAIKREDSRINHQDFVARMLTEIVVKTSKGRQSQPLYGKNAMAARMRRFREGACCIVWDVRAGSDKICDYLEGILPARCITDNSTRNFRDLYDHEILELRKPNAGRFAERAGGRAIDEDERKMRAQKQDARIERRKAQFNKGQEPKGKAVERKRKRAATKDTSTEEDKDDEEELSDFAAGRGATAPRRKQRKTNPATRIGVSRKRKPSEADWDEDFFELRDDGDNEGRQYNDEGCANPNANREGRQIKRPKLINNTESAFGRTPRFWTSAMPVVDSTVASSTGFQDSTGQEIYDADRNQFVSINAVNSTNDGISAVDTVSEPRMGDLENGFALNEEMSNFYGSLSDDPNATLIVDTSSVNTSNAAPVNDDVVDFGIFMAQFEESSQYDSNLPSIQWDGLDALLGTTTQPSAEPNVEPKIEGTDLLGTEGSYFDQFMLPFESEDNAPPY